MVGRGSGKMVGKKVEEDGHEWPASEKKKERAQGATGAQSPTWVLSLRCCSDGRRVKKTTMTTTRTTSRLPCNGEEADTRSIHQVHSPQDEHSGAKRSIGVYCLATLFHRHVLISLRLFLYGRHERSKLGRSSRKGKRKGGGEYNRC